MHWNHRVIRLVDAETLEITLMIAEVYYNDKGKPYAYGEPFLTGETLDDLTETLNRLQAARLQPVLAYPGDFDFTDDVADTDFVEIKVPSIADDDDTPVAPV